MPTTCDSCGKTGTDTTEWICVTNATSHLHADTPACAWKLEQQLGTATDDPKQAEAQAILTAEANAPTPTVG